MKRELKTNYQSLTELHDAINRYVIVLGDLDGKVGELKRFGSATDRFLADSIVQSYENYDYSIMAPIVEELSGLKSLISDYVEEMSLIVEQINDASHLRIGRDDNWYNIQQIKSPFITFEPHADASSIISAINLLEHGERFRDMWKMTDEEKLRHEQNEEIISSACSTLTEMNKEAQRILSDDIEPVYQKVKEFENTDDDYVSKVKSHYADYATQGDKFSDQACFNWRPP